MPSRCVVNACPGTSGPKAGMHTFPSDPNLRREWEKFVQLDRPWNLTSKFSCICSLHFEEASFTNFLQVKSGFGKHLFLKPDAIPTIRKPITAHENSERNNTAKVIQPKSDITQILQVKHPEASQNNRESEQDLRKDEPVPDQPKDVAVQHFCFSVPVATQCSIDNKLSVRSRGVQTSNIKTRTVGFTCKRRWPRKRKPSFTVSPATSTPRKKINSSKKDPSFTLSDSSEDEQETLRKNKLAKQLHLQQKYIVFRENLWELFATCPICARSCDIEETSRGTFIAVYQKCSQCEFSRKWESQPFIEDVPAGNILLSGSIFFTGGSYSSTKKIFDAMKIGCICESTYYKHSRLYLQPTSFHLWNYVQECMFDEMKVYGKDIPLGRDMRADTPGHCAKYGSYTMMDLHTDRVIDIQLIQSNEVEGSNHMEKEGLIRSVKTLAENDLEINQLVTDRHPQVQKYIREEMEDTDHRYDVWHVVKGVVRKLENLAKEKDCSDLRPWIRSIKNHLYWSASSSSSGAEIKAKWISLVNHIADIHIHDDPLFPSCLHDTITAEDERAWLTPNTKVYEKAVDILLNKRFLCDVGKLSTGYQTSRIEAFHGLILKFCPKNVVFWYRGMLCRLYIAALHHNENVCREQAKNKSGHEIFKLRFPKYKKGAYAVVPVKSEATFDYVADLLELMQLVVANPKPFQENLDLVSIPPPLSDDFEKPLLADAVSNYVSRFNKSK